MVLCGTTPERRASKDLEKKISSWMKDYKKAIKILLLGAGESGKTTIIKQMKILHISGFTPDTKTPAERSWRRRRTSRATSWRPSRRWRGTWGSWASPLARRRTEDSWEYISGIDPQGFTFPQEFYEHTERLWRDAGIREVYAQQHKFQLIDCSKYFLDKVSVLKQPDYVPSVQDILHSRRRTTNIQKIEFEVKIPRKYGGGGSLTFWMFDVGGQRGERKKWIQVFDGIQTVLFLVSASCFDLVVREDEATNRLQESIKIFQNVWVSRFLKDAGFIVFLNKQDILKDKVVNSKKRIGDYFPDYANYKLDMKDRDPNEDEEYQKTRCFIRDKFLVMSPQIFERCWIHRFLNKQDILKDKVVNSKKRIGDYFPDYANYKLDMKDRDPNEDEEYQKTRCFIRDKFLEIAKQQVTREARKLSPGFSVAEEERVRECYWHFTTATDTNNVKLVFEDVHNMIIMWNLHEIGVKMA
ncbi:guanine nucleotide-binding protein G(s) subunit alpha-like [Penaeus monodon]|uniref:guanine nucleotide-binding protein G(s) subunit alpha-like n=1 Tax=Penaeus monodon TaxID=6687 RepID=UPI0018A72AEA|nr:guanine nucleotide-binding protein G(s) subunit alpha-like [Penaeus monodon]